MENKFQRKMYEFFKDRNGFDELAILSFIMSFVFSILNIIFPNIIVFYILSMLMVVYTLFRILSKNRYKRQQENMMFKNLLSKIFKKKSTYKKKKNIKAKTVKVKKEKEIKDKNYIYRPCPNCNNTLKISKKKKGNRLIMCTKCYNEINIKV